MRDSENSKTEMGERCGMLRMVRGQMEMNLWKTYKGRK